MVNPPRPSKHGCRSLRGPRTHQFIQRTRADILHQLKIAFRELVVAEAFYLEGDAFYATLGTTQATDDSNTYDETLERPGKRWRTRKW